MVLTIGARTTMVFLWVLLLTIFQLQVINREETLCVRLNTNTYPQTQDNFRIFTAAIHFRQVLLGIMKTDLKSDC